MFGFAGTRTTILPPKHPIKPIFTQKYRSEQHWKRNLLLLWHWTFQTLIKMAFDVHFESGILSVKTVRDFYLALKHTNPRVQIKMGPDTRRSWIFWVKVKFLGYVWISLVRRLWYWSFIVSKYQNMSIFYLMTYDIDREICHCDNFCINHQFNSCLIILVKVSGKHSKVNHYTITNPKIHQN